MDRIQMYLTATEHIAEFSETVVGLQAEKKSAIWEMGFGAIQNMGCPKLCERVCSMMLHNIDPLNQTVEIHGCTLSITVSDFARVMGINDGGMDIEFRGSMDHSLMKYVRSYLVESNAVDVTRSSLKNVVFHREVVDSIFRVAFVMYSLSAVLCPSNEIEVDEILILHLMQTRSIKDLNWATYCFNKMIDSVLTLKLMGQGGKYVCMLFLQLYYFDAVGNSLGWVDKGTTPIMFWANDNVGHLMGWMARQVGSPTMPKWLQSEPYVKNCGPNNCLDNSGSSQRKSDRAEEQLKIAISEIELVKTQMRELYSRVSRIEPLIEHLSNVAEKVCQEMSDLNGGIKTMVGEMLKHIKPITNENPNFIVPEMGPTEVKSNSAHFNGGNKANVAAKSSDYSLRFLYTNPPKKQDGKCVQENPGKVGKEKGPIVDVYECSVSPGDPPKNSRRGRKEKQRRSVVVAPKTIVCALFKTRANTGANLRPAIRSNDSQRMRGHKIYAGPFLLHGNQKQDDIDLLDFLFMERTTDDTYSRAVVATHEGMEVSRKELQCLGPGNLVCNMVINTFAAYLNEIGSGCWFLPTFFQIYSRGKGSADISTQEWIAHTKTICRLHRFPKQIETCVRVFIPLHEEAQRGVEIGHWYFLVVHIRARYAEILDSCPTESKKVSRMQAARQAMCMLDVVFGDDIVAAGSLSINIGSLPFKISGNAPRQPNAQDCGVFVIKNMQSYGSDWAAKYDSNSQRASLVLDCVRHPRNEVTGLHEMVQEALGLWRRTKVAV